MRAAWQCAAGSHPETEWIGRGRVRNIQYRNLLPLCYSSINIHQRSLEARMLSERQSTATILLLLRHGENEWVSSGRLAGRTPGVHLNDKGRAQAEALAGFLQRQPIRSIYSSPLERCLETARPLAAALGLPVCQEPGMIEVDYGDWRGLEIKELDKLPAWQRVQHFPSLFRFPGGETLRETQQRAVESIERIAARHANEVVALFSHGDVIRTVLAHFAGTPLDLFQRIHIATASLSTLAIFDGRPAILNMNVTAELPVFEIKQPEPPAGTETNGAFPPAAANPA